MSEIKDETRGSDPKYAFRSEAPLPREERVARLLKTLEGILKAGIYDLPLEMYLNTCAKCNYYIAGASASAPGQCKVEAGPISPNGWCVLFAPKPH